MPTKIEFPPDEKVDLLKEGEKKRKEGRVVYTYRGEECKDLLKLAGSLEKEAFSSLENWVFFRNKEGHGMAYRVGIKENVPNIKGDLTTYILHFSHPFTLNGVKPSSKVNERHYSFFEDMSKQVSKQMREVYDTKIVSLVLSPPDWMFDELMNIVKSRKEDY